LLSKTLFDELFTQQMSITTRQQFDPDALIETKENMDINLGHGLG
jgi:hypothetical protein